MVQLSPQHSTKRSPRHVIIGSALIISTLIASYLLGRAIDWGKIFSWSHRTSQVATTDSSSGSQSFPAIDTSSLNPTRRRIIELSKAEFDTQSPGTKFSQGVQEAWCADFVSWILSHAQAPLKNPHTGGWRIPGTFTLREYYQANGRFRPASSGYQPQPGDVAIYRHSPVFGNHTNIVIKNDHGVLTTVGGNEGNRIRVYQNSQKQYDGLLGYGVLAE